MPEDNRYSDNRYSYLSNQSYEESQRSSQHGGTIKRLVRGQMIKNIIFALYATLLFVGLHKE